MEKYTLQKGFTGTNHWCCIDTETGLICSWKAEKGQQPIFAQQVGFEPLDGEFADKAISEMLSWLGEHHAENLTAGGFQNFC